MLATNRGEVGPFPRSQHQTIFIMNNKKVLQAPQAAKLAPLTAEEKKAQVVRFIAQKREQFATGILFNLMQNPVIMNGEYSINEVVDKAVEGADAIMEKLYPLPKEEETNK